MAEHEALEVRRIGGDEAAEVEAAGLLFDRVPQPEAIARFLASDTHHLLIAYVAGEPAGFVTGIETIHPDKGSEMMLYELGVDPRYRRRRVGTSLVEALAQLARRLGCYGMWVPVDADDSIPIATYRAAGAGDPEDAAILTWEF